MRKLGEKKVFVIDCDSLKELVQDDKIKHLLNVSNHSKRNRIICGSISKIERIIKRKYNCSSVMFDTDILGFLQLQNGNYKPYIDLPIRCGCCGVFEYKINMYDNKICRQCYRDAYSHSKCARCGLYSLECNCD